MRDPLRKPSVWQRSESVAGSLVYKGVCCIFKNKVGNPHNGFVLGDRWGTVIGTQILVLSL